MITVVAIETPELGDRSYLAHDGTTALVVDPQRDIDRVLAAAGTEGVRIACVAETHLHNDYVSGGRALAALTGAAHLVGGGEDVGFPCSPARDGERHRVGRMDLAVIATPGHTPGHVAYGVGAGGRATVVFTGGSLLFGSVGRTDLVDPGMTEGLARQQFRSARRVAAEVGDGAEVCPTHGFGSFCSSQPAIAASSSTIREEKARNTVFSSTDEDTFVAEMLSGLDDYPSYYARMGPLNRSGPPAADLTPPPLVGAGELARGISEGVWAVDLRERRRFAASHVAGSIGFELDTLFTTYFGWVVPAGATFELIGPDAPTVAEAQRCLARIGVDRPAGMALGSPAQLASGQPASYPVADFAALARRLGHGDLAVLDVRSNAEWRAGHLRGALHAHLPDLEAKMSEVPDGEVWVHCATGYRASIGAGLLARAGRSPVLVDDDWHNAAGLPMEAPG